MAQTGRILSFLGARRPSNDWTQQELAEFYRVESALLQNGLLVVTERGLSDEGDPWFVFCLSKNEEVIAHFARIDGYYFVVSSAFSGVARGRDFKLLVRELMDAHPLLLPGNHGCGPKVFLHPAASLAALLAASYLVSSEKGAEIQDISTAHEKETAFWLHFRQDLAILSAVAIAATWIENSIETAVNLGQDIAPLQDVGQDANLPADLPPHAIDAAVFNATQAPHDDGATHRVGSSPAQPFALEAMKDVNEVIPGNFMASKLLKDPSQSTVTTSPAASNVDGAAASHADSTKTTYSGALHDADTPHSASTDPEQGLAHPSFVMEARQPLGSSATAPTSTNLGPGSMIPTDTLQVATNDLIVSNQQNSSLPVVVSTLPPSSSEIQNVAMSTLSTSSDTASTNASAQEVVSASTPPSSANEVASTPPSSANEVVSTSTPHSLSDVHPTTFNAQTFEASLLAFLHHSHNLTVADSHITVEPTHTIVGIVPHMDGTHT
jgi:hypothetical protein